MCKANAHKGSFQISFIHKVRATKPVSYTKKKKKKTLETFETLPIKALSMDIHFSVGVNETLCIKNKSFS